MKTVSILSLLVVLSSSLTFADDAKAPEGFTKLIHCYASGFSNENVSNEIRPGYLDEFILYVDSQKLKEVQNLEIVKEKYASERQTISMKIGVRGLNQQANVFTLDAKMHYEEPCDDSCYRTTQGFFRVAVKDDENIKNIISENPRLTNKFSISFFSNLKERLSPKTLTLFGFPELYDCESYTSAE